MGPSTMSIWNFYLAFLYHWTIYHPQVKHSPLPSTSLCIDVENYVSFSSQYGILFGYVATFPVFIILDFICWFKKLAKGVINHFKMKTFVPHSRQLAPSHCGYKLTFSWTYLRISRKFLKRKCICLHLSKWLVWSTICRYSSYCVPL